MQTLVKVSIDKEFQALIPPLTKEEKELLTNSILKEGCREPIILWGDTLIDGHNRYEICSQYEIPFKTIQKEFENREDCLVWIIKNQFGRRNLDTWQRTKLSLRLEDIIASKARENKLASLKQYQVPTVNQKSDERIKSDSRLTDIPEPIKPITTNKELGKIANVSHDTIAKAKKIQEKAKPEQIEKLEKGEASINQVYTEIKKQEKREERVQKIVEISQGNEELKTDKKYPVIYADPPWKYEHCYDSADEIENHYPTMTIEQMCEMPVPEITTPDCILFMWTTAPKLEESFNVINAWGFNYRTNAVWDKQHIGMGYWFRGQHELLLVATKGSIPVPEFKVSSVFSEKRTKHSKKPEYFREVIEKMFPEFSKIELFCREAKEGWDVWGNQSK